MKDSRIRLIAGAAQMYEGRRLRSGEGFEASHKDALDLIAIGFASIDREEVKHPDTGVVVVIEKPRKKRQYKRRDMVAE